MRRINRSKYFRGQIDKYTWVNYGSSYLPSDMDAAYLYGHSWNWHRRSQMPDWHAGISTMNYLQPLKERGILGFRQYRKAVTQCTYVLCETKDIEERSRLIDFPEEEEMESGQSSIIFLFILHRQDWKFSEFRGEDVYTTKE